VVVYFRIGVEQLKETSMKEEGVEEEEREEGRRLDMRLGWKGKEKPGRVKFR
jgi:hypothetical protein